MIDLTAFHERHPDKRRWVLWTDPHLPEEGPKPTLIRYHEIFEDDELGADRLWAHDCVVYGDSIPGHGRPTTSYLIDVPLDEMYPSMAAAKRALRRAPEET